MPDFTLGSVPAGSVEVGGKLQTGSAAVGGVTGPRAFPPPPCPPPPVLPLGVVTVKISNLDPTYLEWIFDGPAYHEEVLPNWTCTEQPLYHPNYFDIYGTSGGANLCVAISHAPVAGNHIVVPANCGGMRSLSGGYIAPGTYVIAPV